MLAYLSRYTHRVAISNSGLIALDEAGVTFYVKDYRRSGDERYRTMTLDQGEFIAVSAPRAAKGFTASPLWAVRERRHRANIARARELLAALSRGRM